MFVFSFLPCLHMGICSCLPSCFFSSYFFNGLIFFIYIFLTYLYSLKKVYVSCLEHKGMFIYLDWLSCKYIYVRPICRSEEWKLFYRGDISGHPTQNKNIRNPLHFSGLLPLQKNWQDWLTQNKLLLHIVTTGYSTNQKLKYEQFLKKKLNKHDCQPTLNEVGFVLTFSSN